MNEPPEKPEPYAPPEADTLGDEAPSSDDRLWATLAHVSIFVFGIFGPLIIWLVKKEESPFVEDQAKEALNFHLTILIASLVCTATCIGLLLLPVISVGGWVYGVLAAIDANKGIRYRYPYTLRMIN